MNRENPIKPIFLLLAAVLFFVAGCDNKPEKLDEQLNYRLKWLFNISVAGDLYADAHHIFADQGLSVAVKPGGPERDAIKELEIGRAHFGVASADQVIRAVAKGAPIVVIAQLFQVNPLQWLYRSGQGEIKSPRDLKNKTIGITYGGNDETIMNALLAKHAINKNEVKLFSVRYDYSPFYQGKVNLWPIYRNAEGIVIADKLGKQGEKADFFNPDDFGVRFVANSIITTKNMIEEHPDIVKKFRKALLKGWQEALAPANAQKTIAIVHQFDQDTPVAIIGKQLEVTRKIITPPPGKQIGWINVTAWRETEKIMHAQKLIAGPVDVEKILFQGEKL